MILAARWSWIVVLVSIGTAACFHPAAAATTEAVPPPTEVERATQALRTQYKELKRKADSSLVVALLDGLERIQSAAERYAQVREAIDLATKLGDAEQALRALRALTHGFSVDATAEQLALLNGMAHTVRTPYAAVLVIQQALLLYDSAITQDDWERASQIIAIASTFVGTAKDIGLTVRVHELQALVAEVAKEAKRMPKIDPLNSLSREDSERLGRFTCFLKNDWPTGLPLLAAGTDVQLKALSAREIKAQQNDAQWITIADGWWDVAGKLKGHAHSCVQNHAVAIYRRFLPTLSGITQTRVQKRLAKLPEDKGNLGTIDLWPLLHLDLPGTTGKWHMEGTNLVVDAGEPGDHLTMPLVPAGDYRCEVEFSQIGRAGEVMIFFPIPLHHPPISINTFLADYKNNIDLINGEKFVGTNTSSFITVGKRQHFIVEVLRQQGAVSIHTSLNDQEAHSWQGPESTLFQPHANAPPSHPGALALGSWLAEVHYHRASLTMLSGQAITVAELADMK